MKNEIKKNHTYIHIHTYTYIYIYTYIHKWGGGAALYHCNSIVHFIIMFKLIYMETR